MEKRTVIIILSLIIIIQMIAGIFIIFRKPAFSPQVPPFEMTEDRTGMGPGKHHGRHQMPGNRFGRYFCEPEFMRDRLSLNQDQIDRISVLNKNFDNDFAGYIKQIEPERKKLKDMLDNDTKNMNVVKDQLKKIEAINTEIHLLRIKQGQEIKNILTPEQMNMLKNERNMFFEKMQRDNGGKR